jgi:hypothetical protein
MYSVPPLVQQNAHFQSLLHDVFSPVYSQDVQILGVLIQPEINLLSVIWIVRDLEVS